MATELALTLWNPWAQAITGYFDRGGRYVPGPKRIENRPWPPPTSLIGQRFWIHAGKVFDDEGYDRVRGLWPACPLIGAREWARGAFVGSARLGGWRGEDGRSAGEWLTTAEDQEGWWMGPYGWLLRDVEVLPVPVPCNGFQKLWSPTPFVLEKLALAQSTPVTALSTSPR